MILCPQVTREAEAAQASAVDAPAATARAPWDSLLALLRKGFARHTSPACWCRAAGGNKSVHVDVQSKLGEATLAGLTQDSWPTCTQVDKLATEVRT